MQKQSSSVDAKDLPSSSGNNTGWPWVESDDAAQCSSRLTETGSWPRISVVTPSFNQAEFLEAAIRSVLLQRYPNFEYIIMDGGSVDDSVSVIKQYEQWIDCWVSEPDNGQSHALNKGFRKASGDIFCWLNSDDIFEPDAFFKVADAWRLHQGNLIIAGECREFSADGMDNIHRPSFQSPAEAPRPLPLNQVLDLANGWLSGHFFYQPEVFFPRKVFEAVGGIDESLHYAMDYDLWIRLALHGTPIVTLIEPLAGFRFHDAQKTADRNLVLKETVTVAAHYLVNPRIGLDSQQRADIARRNKRLLIANYVPPLLRRIVRMARNRLRYV